MRDTSGEIVDVPYERETVEEAWGLTRRERVFEAEDHVAALCDAMRWLIVHRNPLEEQRDFFAVFVAPAVPRFCDAINRISGADFYRKVGAFTRAFVALEQEAFDIIQRYQTHEAAYASLTNVWESWKNIVGAINIVTVASRMRPKKLADRRS